MAEATKIVMVNGDTFTVEIDVNKAASDILIGADPHVLIEPIDAMRTYLKREHIAYVQAVSTDPMIG
jgi:hypothetical protein